VENVSQMLPSAPGNATLTMRMHDVLEAAIIEGELKPGERIHADSLALRYGMSRIPVREALRSLHEAGWVEIKPRHGVHVRERNATELAELFEFRANIEALVARWAAERRTDDELAELAAIVTFSQDAPGAAPVQSASSFYAKLRQAAHNSVLETTSAALEKRARFYFSTVAHELGEDWRHVHEQLLDLVEKRDGNSAAAVAEQHIRNTGKAVRALLFADEQPPADRVRVADGAPHDVPSA